MSYYLLKLKISFFFVLNEIYSIEPLVTYCLKHTLYTGPNMKDPCHDRKDTNHSFFDRRDFMFLKPSLFGLLGTTDNDALCQSVYH